MSHRLHGLHRFLLLTQLRLRRYSGHTESTESTERLFKLHDAVYANGTVGYLVDKDVGRMHILSSISQLLGLPVWPVPAFELASRLVRA